MSLPGDATLRVLRYILWMLPGVALALPAYGVSRRRRCLRAGGLPGSKMREAGVLALFLYSGGMAALTLCPHPGWLYAGLCGHWSPYFAGWWLPLGGRVNLIPFSQGDSLFNLAGNIVMFLPFGFLADLLGRGWSWKRELAAGFGITVFIECWQVLVGRYFDVDDILLNTLGFLCGCGLGRLARRLAPGWGHFIQAVMRSIDE